MDIFIANHQTLFQWVLLPALIFFSRIADVSIGTVRIIMVSRGQRLAAPILGFFEVLIWLVVIAQVMQNLDNWICYVAYAGGFAAGTLAGMWWEERLAVGFLVVRIITNQDDSHIKERFAGAGIGVTSIDAEGISGRVKVVFSVIKRNNLGKVIQIINDCYPKAFFSVEDARSVAEGIFPRGRTGLNLRESWPLSALRRVYGRSGK